MTRESLLVIDSREIGNVFQFMEMLNSVRRSSFFLVMYVFVVSTVGSSCVS